MAQIKCGQGKMDLSPEFVGLVGKSLWYDMPHRRADRQGVEENVQVPRHLVNAPLMTASRAVDYDWLVDNGRRPFYEWVEEQTRKLLADLERWQEAKLEDFLMSGAMPRDLSIECGLPYVEQVPLGGARGEYRLVARQVWRIK